MMLLNDILDLSKIEAGKLTTEITTCNPAKIIQNIKHLFHDLCDQKGVKITDNSDDFENQWVKTDGLRLRQIISNIVSNAVKFTENGYIDIQISILKITSEKSTLRIIITDSGIGMNEEQLKSVFDPFTQADTSTTRKYGGTGLGLTITKQLCELLKGRLDVKSQLDHGSTFTIDLPVFQALAPEHTKNTTHIYNELSILLAEDNPINQKVVTAMLQKNGHDVDIADNGKIAVEIANHKKCDVILMDMQMPEMGGLEATSIIRNQSNYNQDTLVLAFTADAFPEHHREFGKLGIKDVITKPFKWHDLEQKLAEHLEHREN